MSDLSPLRAAKRTCHAIHDPICFSRTSGALSFSVQKGSEKPARELHQQKIARNPKRRDTSTAGRGYIVGGAKPPEQSVD